MNREYLSSCSSSSPTDTMVSARCSYFSTRAEECCGFLLSIPGRATVFFPAGSSPEELLFEIEVCCNFGILFLGISFCELLLPASRFVLDPIFSGVILAVLPILFDKLFVWVWRIAFRLGLLCCMAGVMKPVCTLVKFSKLVGTSDCLA